jgi:hypothetical protein
MRVSLKLYAAMQLKIENITKLPFCSSTYFHGETCRKKRKNSKFFSYFLSKEVEELGIYLFCFAYCW